MAWHIKKTSVMGSSAAGDGTRAIFHGGGGSDPAHMTSTTQCQKITTQTLGNATAVGSISTAKMMTFGGSNGTRGIYGHAGAYACGQNESIRYMTIATTGNASDFGDLGASTGDNAGLSSTTRAVSGGGSSPGNTNVIEFTTIASVGNATDFGDLTEARRYLSGLSSSTRGVFAFGNNPSGSNVMDYITIASAGNATDFGDLTDARYGPAPFSDSHGGLGD